MLRRNAGGLFRTEATLPFRAGDSGIVRGTSGDRRCRLGYMAVGHRRARPWTACDLLSLSRRRDGPGARPRALAEACLWIAGARGARSFLGRRLLRVGGIAAAAAQGRALALPLAFAAPGRAVAIAAACEFDGPCHQPHVGGNARSRTRT